MKTAIASVVFVWVVLAQGQTFAQDDAAPECTTCNGTGIMKKLPGRFAGFVCPTCGGEGKLRKPRTYFGREVPPGYHLCNICGSKGATTFGACEKCKKCETPGIIKSGAGYRMCEDCGGFGQQPGARCKDCNGLGYVKDADYAEKMGYKPLANANSTAAEGHTCIECGGTGVLKKVPGKFAGFKCPMCEGEGKVTKERTWLGREIPAGYHTCRICAGKGTTEWAPCDKCRKAETPGILKGGMGYRTCEVCNGYSELPGTACKECHGLGYSKD